MCEHVRECHGGVVGENGGIEDFKVKVSESFSKCLQRQVDEDIRMQEYETSGGQLLNSKYEYYTSKSVQTIFTSSSSSFSSVQIKEVKQLC